MMPSLGAKKRESRAERRTEELPQLSNEMQLSIMNRVKRGELSIEDALHQARKDEQQLMKKRSLSEELLLQEEPPSQYNFSVHKHSHMRWQKRVLQIDFKTKMLCSIEKGIIKRQLAFSTVKSCDDGAGSRFTISFKGHHDYELEATSLEDKHKLIQLVNQIIYGNIYSDPGDDDNAETCEQPPAPRSLREGVLLLHRGGLASFKWVKYEVRLHPGQLTLVPCRRRSPADGEVTSVVPASIVIHLSDGDTSVEQPQGCDTFTLITHKNEYQFRVPMPDQTAPPGAVQSERDAWVQAIHGLCSDWKRKSMGEHMFVGPMGLRHISVVEDVENADADPESGAHLSPQSENSTSGGGDLSSAGVTGPRNPSADKTKPVPRPRSKVKSSCGDLRPDVPPPPPSPTPASSSQTSPAHAALTPSPTVPESLTNAPGSSAVKEPSCPRIPAPPPLPFRMRGKSKEPRTKPFHWDALGSEKVVKSFWKHEPAGGTEIDTARLLVQFAVKSLGKFDPAEPSNMQHILLNEKIAHNFNIFLKSFPVRPAELKDKLFVVNEEDGGLSDEHIASLRRYVPTVDDVEMYKSHKGPVEELHIVDQYMMEMCNIPYLSSQLDLLLTLRELPISMNDLQPLINQKIRMCTQLSSSGSFVSVLEYLLAIGNYLNENARKEKAKGFRLSSLAKLSQLRGRDRKFTLLHALVEQIMLHRPCVATFTQELAEFETVPGASIKGLTAEVDVLKNELEKVFQYRKTSKNRNAGVQPPNFSTDLKTAIEKYKADLSALTKTCEEMKKLYSVILVKFGEPADQDSQELFGLICQFIHDFKRAHAEMI